MDFRSKREIRPGGQTCPTAAPVSRTLLSVERGLPVAMLVSFIVGSVFDMVLFSGKLTAVNYPSGNKWLQNKEYTNRLLRMQEWKKTIIFERIEVDVMCRKLRMSRKLRTNSYPWT